MTPLPSPSQMSQRALVAQALAHPLRQALLEAIGTAGAYVNDLVLALGRPQPHVSRHLAVLREAGLVVTERQGTYIRYRLAPGVAELLAALAKVAERLPAGGGWEAGGGPPRRWRGGRRRGGF